MLRFHNVRLRFTLLYGAALVATVILFSCGVYFFVRQMLIGQIDNHLRNDIATITEYLRHDPAGLEKLARFGSISYFRVQEDGLTILATEEWISDRLDLIIPEGDPAPEPRSVKSSDKRLFRTITLLEPQQSPRFQIVVAHDEERYQNTLGTLALIIILIIPVSIAISLAVGYMIAGRVLAPVAAITRRAEAITAENLSERLPVDDTGDELSRLAEVFNRTFARLEESFERLRRFTADASHELRTPLTAIRSIGETALSQQADPFDCQETIGSILEETDRLAQTVEALLMLSRADSRALEKEPTEIGALVEDAIDFLGVLAEEKDQKILFENRCPLTIDADPCLLRRAFLNLLDNAIKYSPKGGVIRISIQGEEGGEASIIFADNGPGIPVPEREKVFNRFYRLDSGRSRNRGGTGLGLAIAKAAVEIHGGSITLEEGGEGGAVFKVNFIQQETHTL